MEAAVQQANAEARRAQEHAATARVPVPPRESRFMSGRQRLRIIACDPGRKADPFGIVFMDWHASQADAEKRGAINAAPGQHLSSAAKPCIVVHEAVQFIRRPYSQVAKEVGRMARQVHPDLVLVESNGEGGQRAIDAFRAQGIQRIAAVACAGENCSEATMRAGTAYSKPAIVQYAQAKLGSRSVVWGESDSLGELRQQLREFVWRRTPSGTKTYARQRGRHDDLAMAFLLGCSAARRAEYEWAIGEGGRRLAAEQEADARERERQAQADAAPRQPSGTPPEEQAAIPKALAATAARRAKGTMPPVPGA